MSSGNKQITAEQFLAAIPGSGGIITTIAKRVGCAWGTAHKFIHSHPTVLKAYHDEQESIVDMAEGVLYKSIQEGNTQDAKWVLARLRRQRYGDNVEVNLSGQVDIIEIIRDASNTISDPDEE